MEANFWHDMWKQEFQGFHQAEINDFLLAHWQKLELTGAEKVLVPLCGKSLDMVWLAQQGHEVLGIELSQKALDEFVNENKVPAKLIKKGHFSGYELERMRLLCGDFFKITAEDCLEVKAVYDRAAIVALPPEMRQSYAVHLKAIQPKGTQFLMVIMDYDQTLMSGPPFAVSETEVRDLFSGFESIDVVETVNLERKGVSITEKAIIMTV